MKNMSSFLIGLMVLITVPMSFAGGSLTQSKIEAVAFQTGGFFLYSNTWPNPNSCTNSNAVVLLDTDINYEKAYALLLAAYMSGKMVSGYSNGCVEFDGKTYNSIRGYKYLFVQ